MFFAYGPLMCSYQPASQQRGYTMNAKQSHMDWITRLRKNNFLQGITVARKSIVSLPTIGQNDRTMKDHLPNEFYKTISTHVWYLTQSNASKTFGFMNLHICYYDRLLFSVSAGHTCFLATSVSLVDFDATIQQVTPGSDHSPTQFVKPSPSSLVAAQTQRTLHPQRASTKFLVGHMRRCLKPYPQRFADTVKDRPCGYRDMTLTASAGLASMLCMHLRWEPFVKFL